MQAVARSEQRNRETEQAHQQRQTEKHASRATSSRQPDQSGCRNKRRHRCSHEVAPIPWTG